MPHELDGLVAMVTFNEQALSGAVKDFQDEDWLHRPGGANHALWVVGHIAVYRREWLRKLKVNEDPLDWEEKFKMGSKPGATTDDPSPRTLIDDIALTGQSLHRHLPTLLPEQLAEPHGLPFPKFAPTLAGFCQFMLWHESYHVGQVGLIRRVRGMKGLA